MKSKTCRFTSKLAFIVSALIIFFALSVLVYEVFIVKSEVNFAIYSIPISLGLALLSISFALDSNAKMVDNANERFLKIAVDFVEARARYIATHRSDPSKALEHIKHFLWWSKIHLLRVGQIDTRIIKSENQKYFYVYFRITIWQIFDSFKIKWDDLRQTDRDFIIDMYSRVREFDRNPGEERKLMKHFEQYMGKYEIESEQNFFRRLQY